VATAVIDAAPAPTPNTLQSAATAEPARHEDVARADVSRDAPATDAPRVPRVRPVPTRAEQHPAETRVVRTTAATLATAPPAPAAATRDTPAPMPSSEPTTQPTAPAQAPVGVAAVTRNPREQCAGRHLVAMHRCLLRECDKPEFQGHRECQRVRDIEARTRNVLGG